MLEEILLKTMHFWAGVGVRGAVEVAYKLAMDYSADRHSEEITALDEFLFYFRNYGGRETVGFAVPLVDALLDYVPEYKTRKDAVVSQFTHAPSIPPDIGDQVNDAFWFLLGYFLPETFGMLKKNYLELIKIKSNK